MNFERLKAGLFLKKGYTATLLDDCPDTLFFDVKVGTEKDLQRLKAILEDHMEWHFKAIDQSLTMTLSAIGGYENWYVLASPVLRFDEEAANAYGGNIGAGCYHVFTALNANTLGVKCICLEGNKVMAVYEFKALDEDTILQSVEEMAQPVINAFCQYIEAIIFVHDQIEGTEYWKQYLANET